ncbi:MAG: hypothetical protein ACK4YQ_16485 [Phenylobacterium sp.]|uniref:hypothetical protein n=1 Tax=Phenylobacterium sp. TaxID=1871053 RepID=UPI003918BB60
MKRIDLDDLPPKLAQLLTSLEDGEELLLVRDGMVEGRLTGAAAPPAAGPDAETPDDPERMGEVMEHFRAMMEDDF